MKRKNLVVLGATGSIGDSTLKVVRGNPERLNVVGIAGKKNYEKLAKIADEFDVKHVAIFDDAAYSAAEESGLFKGRKLYRGEDGLMEIALLPEADTVVAAVVGTQALKPTLAAIKAGKDIALANKELLVMAGKFVMGYAKENNVAILPLDSEHNAIFQCLNGERKKDVAKLLITASGGMFREYTREQMLTIKPEQALKHPNWNMGAKITIDSATLMNKGFECIEAVWLFGVRPEQVEVVVHRESVIHSMVEFEDYAVLGQMGVPDMKIPIQYALTYPARLPSPVKQLRLEDWATLTFYAPDNETFPAMQMARRALRQGGLYPAALNAANEVAVEAFLEERIGFLDIPRLVGETLDRALPAPGSIDDVLAADEEIRRCTRARIDGMK